jgi:glycosyltransferase involved in cell wall biosynthesis
MRPRLTVIIPSRAQADQEKFLARALASIAGQSAAAQFEIHVVIGVDAGCAPRVPSVAGLTVVCAESAGSSQAAALNAALARVSAGFVAFLEDDDQWLPEYLLYAVAAIAHCDFVSSTQLEVGDDGVVLRIHDFIRLVHARRDIGQGRGLRRGIPVSSRQRMVGEACRDQSAAASSRRVDRACDARVHDEQARPRADRRPTGRPVPSCSPRVTISPRAAAGS